MYKYHIISTKNELRTSPFGWRTLGGVREHHDGLDVVDAKRLEKTSDVLSIALADGVVVDKHNGASIGHGIDILHAGNILTRQYHFRTASALKVGDKVKADDKIGILGTTGRSTGIHLHFAVKVNSTRWSNGTFVDPEPYLRGEKAIGGGSPSASPQPVLVAPPQTNAEIAVGDKVRVVHAVQYNGEPFKTWYDRYDVIQVSGDRVVIGIGKIVTAAVNIRDLAKV